MQSTGQSSKERRSPQTKKAVPVWGDGIVCWTVQKWGDGAMPAYTNALTADYSSGINDKSALHAPQTKTERNARSSFIQGMSIPFFLLLCLPFQTLAQELEHLGCYVDSTARIFPHKMGDFGDNTPATCSQRCFDQDNGETISSPYSATKMCSSNSFLLAAYIYSNVQYGLGRFMWRWKKFRFEIKLLNVCFPKSAGAPPLSHLHRRRPLTATAPSRAQVTRP